MTGKLMAAMAQGMVESILFARASSRAPALWGLKRRELGPVGLPGWRVIGESPALVTWRRDGERRGEEKESR